MFKKSLLLLAVLITFASVSTEASAPNYYPALLCSNCGFGFKSQHCVKCDKWVNTQFHKARLCTSCGFGSKKQDCVKCGKWTGNQSYEARICNECGFGNKRENCVKCGKWAHQSNILASSPLLVFFLKEGRWIECVCKHRIRNAYITLQAPVQQSTNSGREYVIRCIEIQPSDMNHRFFKISSRAFGPNLNVYYSQTFIRSIRRSFEQLFSIRLRL